MTSSTYDTTLPARRRAWTRPLTPRALARSLHAGRRRSVAHGDIIWSSVRPNRRSYSLVLSPEQNLVVSTGFTVITARDVTDLIGGLQAAEYGVTTIDAQGATGPVKIVFTIVRRKGLEHVVSIIKGFDTNAFYSVDDLQSLQAGIFPMSKGRLRGLVPVPLRLFRSTV